AASFIGVDRSVDTLTLSGAISGAAALTKVGDGTLELTGDTVNSGPNAMNVRTGTLLLNKPAGIQAFTGILTVGDEIGGANVDQVIQKHANQIPAASGITVTSSGKFDLSQSDDGYFGITPTNETQYLNYTGTVTGGNFFLTFAGQSTGGEVQTVTVDPG